MKVRYCRNIGDVLLPICWWDAYVDDVRTSLQWSVLRAKRAVAAWNGERSPTTRRGDRQP